MQHEPSRLEAVSARITASNVELAEAAALGYSFRASIAAEARKEMAVAVAHDEALRAKDAEIADAHRRTLAVEASLQEAEGRVASTEAARVDAEARVVAERESGNGRVAKLDEDLTAAHKATKAAETDALGARAQAADLQARLDVANGTLAGVRTELQAARQDAQAARAETAAARKAADEARADAANARSETAAARKETQAARAETVAAKKATEGARAAAAAAQAEAAAARKDAQTARAEAAAATKAANDAKAAATAAQADAVAARKEAQTARDKLKAYETEVRRKALAELALKPPTPLAFPDSRIVIAPVGHVYQGAITTAIARHGAYWLPVGGRVSTLLPSGGADKSAPKLDAATLGLTAGKVCAAAWDAVTGVVFAADDSGAASGVAAAYASDGEVLWSTRRKHLQADGKTPRPVLNGCRGLAILNAPTGCGVERVVIASSPFAFELLILDAATGDILGAFKCGDGVTPCSLAVDPAAGLLYATTTGSVANRCLVLRLAVIAGAGVGPGVPRLRLEEAAPAVPLPDGAGLPLVAFVPPRPMPFPCLLFGYTGGSTLHVFPFPINRATARRHEIAGGLRLMGLAVDGSARVTAVGVLNVGGDQLATVTLPPTALREARPAKPVEQRAGRVFTAAEDGDAERLRVAFAAGESAQQLDEVRQGCAGASMGL